ncbi:MAG TPA: hypothetical protein VFL13_03860 [Candidatus Baltobacteraceae bacterium]|nr:hypothetical protein [Candidatus Baltobacteraceae bacterium]
MTAALGDTMRAGAACTTNVSVWSGNTRVGDLRVTRAQPAVWRASGFDQYRFIATPDCELNVRDEHALPARSPAANGVATILGTILVCAAMLLLLPLGDRCTHKTQWAGFAGTATAIGVAIFVLFPRYLHNDEIGLNLRRDWGYRGWGYIDTMTEVGRQTAAHGFAGLWNIQDFGKPFLVQALALPFAHAFGSAGPAIVSAMFMALAGAGLATIAFERRGKAAGVAVVALFVFNSVVLAYATSFYQEPGLLAGIVWCVLCWYAAIKRGSTFWSALALICAIAATSSKHPLAALLVGTSTGCLLAYLRVPLRQSAVAAIVSTIGGFAGTLALWPSLWVDPAFRIPFALGARIGFDAVHGYGVPLSARMLNTAVQWLVSLSPLEAVLCAIAVVLAVRMRSRAMLPLAAGLLAALAFTLPTSLFLQHYLLYATPFTLLLAAEGLRAFERVDAAVRIAALALLQALWLLPYLPYTGMARLTCLSAACSLERFGPAEPAYGLREAAAWLRTNADPADAIVTATAPHLLQANLPASQVLSTGNWSDAASERRNIAARMPRFVVAAAYGTYYGDLAGKLGLPLVYASSARDGNVRIYRWNGSVRVRTPDLPARNLAALAGTAHRIVVTDGGAEVRGDSGLSDIIRWAWFAPSDGPKPEPCNLGTGLIVAPARSDLARAYRTMRAPLVRSGAFEAFTIRADKRC